MEADESEELSWLEDWLEEADDDWLEEADEDWLEEALVCSEVAEETDSVTLVASETGVLVCSEEGLLSSEEGKTVWEVSEGWLAVLSAVEMLISALNEHPANIKRADARNGIRARFFIMLKAYHR